MTRPAICARPVIHRRARQGTYSIVARDRATGELGVAVQSHWFSVGPIVPWARPGVGAVATRANVEISYGPRGLELLARGLSAAQALAALVDEDPGADGRHVAIVDAGGGVVVHTGPSCIAHAEHVTGEAVSCQANLMAAPGVGPAMMDAFTRSAGSLADRSLAALDGAEAAGGDARGRQSAALLVVPQAARRGKRASRCASRIIRTRSASCAGCSPFTGPTCWPSGVTSWPGRAATTRLPGSIA